MKAVGSSGDYGQYGQYANMVNTGGTIAADHLRPAPAEPSRIIIP
jgi:hypothetical protein